MKHTERLLFRNRGLIKPIACLTLALSAIISGKSALATTATAGDGGIIWCNGDGSAYVNQTVGGTAYPGDTTPDGITNPLDTWDGWQANPILTNGDLGATAETAAPAAPNGNDRYAIQLNYWNSAANSVAANVTTAPFGYSTGNSCMLFYYNSGNTGQFTITYPATPSVPQQAEIDWVNAHPGAYPSFVPYQNGPTSGGPTGYVSTFKGCSWDNNSCTTGSVIPTGMNEPTKSTDTNVFPELLSNVTSIPSQWSISYNHTYGSPETKDKSAHVWDASYDIWFDTTAQTGEGIAPYASVRGQNDGLEIMVWLNSNGSYVDAGTAGSVPTENQAGLAQPTGHIREQVTINGVLYDVWTGRLDNPYFAHVGGTVIKPAQFPHDCPTLTVNGGPGTTCGTEWNVVSFVATKDNNGTDYRGTTMSMDAKVFTDYILGIQDGLWSQYTSGTPRAANTVLQCPASNMDQDLTAPTGNCLSSSWYLMSVQAGFEPWIGGNGLESDLFRAHVSTASTGIQTGLTNDQGNPIINWQTPFDVVYSGCNTYSASNHAAFTITGTNSNTGAAMTYPSNGVPIDMGAQNSVTSQFTYTVTDQMYPMHGDAVIHFTSACGNVDVPVFIDPSGKIFHSDGRTPVQGANVTLMYSPSGNANGPFVAVPNHNAGLSSPVMQPDDNTLNSMASTSIGSYAWNTVAGYYKISASASGCSAVTTTAQHVTVNNPIENLNIILPCAPPKPLPPPPATPGSSGVTVQLTLNGVDWQNGYCRNVVLTNNTNSAVTWNANFNLPYAGNVTQAWNMNYTKSGNAITANGVGWNNVIQPGQVLNQQGFCATK